MRPVRAAIVLLILALPALAASQAAKPPRPPENAKVLKDLDGTAIREEMRLVAAALGVQCDHCHVQGNFASDEKAPKRMARWMMEVTRGLNAQHFPKYEAKPGESVFGRVTCFTCHQGTTAPRTGPSR